MRSGQKISAWFDERLGRKPFSSPDAGGKPEADRPERRLGFGALTVLLLAVVALSGIYMAMFFQPSPAEARKSLLFMEQNVVLGHYARSLHVWGAFAVVVFVILHILSVVYRGAYRAPRELNWIIGIILLPLISAFIVTGYMLPWDFRAYWVVKTISNWLDRLPLFSGLFQWLLYTDAPNGMVPVGRWFAVHVMVLPLLTGLFLTAHYLLFRRHGAAKKN